MQIMLEKEQRLYEESSTRLKELAENALKLKTDPDFARRESSLHTSVECFYTTLKDRKHKQFLRDLQEFREKRAYNFLQTDKKDLNSGVLV